jgi:hypothetical protein
MWRHEWGSTNLGQDFRLSLWKYSDKITFYSKVVGIYKGKRIKIKYLWFNIHQNMVR